VNPNAFSAHHQRAAERAGWEALATEVAATKASTYSKPWAMQM
jgi:hypothetical protein